MKKRFLAALLALAVTAFLPFLTAPAESPEVRTLKHLLREAGYALSAREISSANTFSADTARAIRFEPGNGVLQVLSYASPEKREAGMQEWLQYWAVPRNVAPIAVRVYLYETERALIWYRPGSAPEENPVRDYLENASLHTYAYTTYPEAIKAQLEVRNILHGLREMGYSFPSVLTAGEGTEEYADMTGTDTRFSADAVCAVQLEPGEGRLLFHEYTSPELREQGAKQRKDAFAWTVLAPGTTFYETEYTLITLLSAPEQAEYGDPVREYLETLEGSKEP